MITVSYIHRNRPKCLERSLATLVGQTQAPDEVILVDSSEDSEPARALLDRYTRITRAPSRIIRPGTRELTRSLGRSVGCGAARTPFVVSTEGDIRFPRTLLERTLCALQEDPLRLVITTVGREDPSGGITLVETRHDCGYWLGFSRERFQQIGGFNPFLRRWGLEDLDFRRRHIQAGGYEYQVPCLVAHQWHDPVPARQEDIDANIEIAAHSRFDGKFWVWDHDGIEETVLPWWCLLS